MTSDDNPVAGTEPSTTANRIGLYSTVLTAVMTVVTFGLAIIAIPNSGAGCRVDCVEYPYLELGYLLMSLSFLFLAPVFADGGRLAWAVR